MVEKRTESFVERLLGKKYNSVKSLSSALSELDALEKHMEEEIRKNPDKKHIPGAFFSPELLSKNLSTMTSAMMNGGPNPFQLLNDAKT